MSNDDLQITDPNDLEEVQETWLAHHNQNIIGFYGSQTEAENALNGYHLSTPMGIDDVSEILKIAQ